MDLKGLTGKNKKEVRWEESLHLIEDTQCQRKRVKKIMEEAYSKYPDGTILFVAFRVKMKQNKRMNSLFKRLNVHNHYSFFIIYPSMKLNIDEPLKLF